MSPESRAKLHAFTEGEELQEVPDEVGKRHPDLAHDASLGARPRWPQ